VIEEIGARLPDEVIDDRIVRLVAEAAEEAR
jgi:hypothetical protein